MYAIVEINSGVELLRVLARMATVARAGEERGVTSLTGLAVFNGQGLAPLFGLL